MNVTKFTTKSGSTYTINKETMWWSRDNPDKNKQLRTCGGRIIHMGALEVGRGTFIQTTPLHGSEEERGTLLVRVILTTAIEKVWEEPVLNWLDRSGKV